MIISNTGLPKQRILLNSKNTSLGSFFLLFRIWSQPTDLYLYILYKVWRTKRDGGIEIEKGYFSMLSVCILINEQKAEWKRSSADYSIKWLSLHRAKDSPSWGKEKYIFWNGSKWGDQTCQISGASTLRIFLTRLAWSSVGGGLALHLTDGMTVVGDYPNKTLHIT